MKYIFITGGVVSGLGKGICAASLGRLLKQRGLRVQNQKFDPYLNVDPGTMSPYQHGEVFVTDDGAETDLDLGHYERFTDESLTAGCSVSAGKVYWSVLCREREGGYLGRTVQIIPHITDEIKSRIYQMDNGTSDVLITEIGGTVGDIESQPFLEAIRQVAAEQGKKNVLFIHVPMIVEIPGSGELKSKPTQHSVKELLSIGIQPDILVCRTSQPMTEDICRKIALFCNMEPDCVIPNTTASTLYEVPLLLEREGLANVVCRKLELACGAPDLTAWSEMVARIKTASRHVSIALVGKYTELHDAYLSVEESLFHAGTANNVIVDINWVDSSKLTQENAESVLGGCAGILVPGGFGDRGIEGMIVAAQYARTHKIPYFGICLGMQIAVIEFARTCWAGRMRIRRNSMSLPSIPSLISCPNRSPSPRRAARCASAHIRACCRRAAAQRRSTAKRKFPNATATAMNSATTSAMRSSPPDWFRPDCPRTDGSSRSSSCRTTRGSPPASSTPNSKAAPTVRTRCSSAS